MPSSALYDRIVAQVDEVATSLWRASGYLLDENVGRFVRKL
jgi:hypothetical protein